MSLFWPRRPRRFRDLLETAVQKNPQGSKGYLYANAVTADQCQRRADGRSSGSRVRPVQDGNIPSDRTRWSWRAEELRHFKLLLVSGPRRLGNDRDLVGRFLHGPSQRGCRRREGQHRSYLPATRLLGQLTLDDSAPRRPALERLPTPPRGLSEWVPEVPPYARTREHRMDAAATISAGGGIPRLEISGWCAASRPDSPAWCRSRV